MVLHHQAFFIFSTILLTSSLSIVKCTSSAFIHSISTPPKSSPYHRHRFHSLTSQTVLYSDASESFSSSSSFDELERLKSKLISICSSSSDDKPSVDSVRNVVNDLEALAEQVGIGQASSHSGLLSGEWELLYSPEDVTRSSPFFWAFRQAVPDQSDQIFAITDAIPPPIKEVGPATQTIELNTNNNNNNNNNNIGTLVSRVKVATLANQATSIMTTRCTILRTDGIDGLRLRIDTTKPEESTLLQKLGPLGSFLDDVVAKPFPSGDALDRIREGSSEVLMCSTFCDDSLRISREGSDERFDDVYVWKRKGFGGSAGFVI